MGKIAVFASGRGSNFEALAGVFRKSKHSICCVICDNPEAPVIEKAGSLKIPVFLAPYKGRKREAAEKDILAYLNGHKPDLLVLAGFMRLLSPEFIAFYRNRIINIHPSLLPKYPGTEGILQSYNSPDKTLGITIHYVDEGMDSGPVLFQKSFERKGTESIEEIEASLHALEHKYYPSIILSVLEKETN